MVPAWVIHGSAWRNGAISLEFARAGQSVGQLGVSVSWDQTEEEAGRF